MVYSKKPRKSKVDVSVSKPKILKSVSDNNKEPSQSRGSIVSNVPSSSLDECMSSKLFSVVTSGKVRLADDKTLDIVDVEDVVLNTSFGTSWTLKDV
ncbi:hypothetical protein Tco_0182815, partial [Tanacetum coccineum]